MVGLALPLLGGIGGVLTIALLFIFTGVNGACCWATGDSSVRGFLLLRSLDEGVCGYSCGVCHLTLVGDVLGGFSCETVGA